MSAVEERLSGIIVFVQVVEAGNFAEAAVRMRVTRSAVGKAIARLEQRLGVRLFQRTTRSLSLTEDGQIYYERCLRALGELDLAEAALDRGRREPSGRLRMSVPVLFGRYCVAPALRELTDRYAGLDVEISFSDRVIDLVEEGFDLAVRVGKLPDTPNLVARPLGTQQMAIWAAPSYLSKHGRPSAAEDTAKHVGIVYGRAGYVAPWRLQQPDGRVVDLAVNGRVRLDDLQAITDAAVAGQGLAWLPCWLVHRHVQDGELELVIGGDQMLSSPIHAVWPKGNHLPSKTRVAIDALVAQMPAHLAYPIRGMERAAVLSPPVAA